MRSWSGVNCYKCEERPREIGAYCTPCAEIARAKRPPCRNCGKSTGLGSGPHVLCPECDALGLCTTCLTPRRIPGRSQCSPCNLRTCTPRIKPRGACKVCGQPVEGGTRAVTCFGCRADYQRSENNRCRREREARRKRG